MNNYEKAVLVNGVSYDIVPGGLRATPESLSLVLLPGDKNLMQVDADLDNAANTGVIQIQDSSGDTIDIKKGYVYQTECRKVKGYVIGRELVTETTEATEATKGKEQKKKVPEYKEVTATVVCVALKKSDLRAEVRDIKDTVDSLVVANLEV